MIGLTQYMLLPLQQIIPKGTRIAVFDAIYWVFLALGTIVGVIVIAYMLYNAYKYREAAHDPEDDVDRPELGELPKDGGKGRKLFLSFALSAIVVSSLIVWTYGTLLYVENKPAEQKLDEGEDPLVIRIEGFQFGWKFYYPNGHSQLSLTVPEDRTVKLIVTSSDVWHNFGITDLRVKSDAIPGQTTETWFEAPETRTYTAKCYELCGQGHSKMNAQVEVVSQSEFQEWYSNTEESSLAEAGWPMAQKSDHEGNESAGESGESDEGGHGRVVGTHVSPVTPGQGVAP